MKEHLIHSCLERVEESCLLGLCPRCHALWPEWQKHQQSGCILERLCHPLRPACHSANNPIHRIQETTPMMRSVIKKEKMKSE